MYYKSISLNTEKYQKGTGFLQLTKTIKLFVT